MRICFYRIGSSVYPTISEIPHQVGVVQSTSSLLEHHMENYSLTGNRGNMIHRMSVVQSLEYDRRASANVNLLRLKDHLGSAAEVARVIRDNFDAVVMTMSNVIRKGPSDGDILPIVEALETDLFVFGIGLQNKIPTRLTELSAGMAGLLQAINAKAKLFGVRGHQTQRWLHTVGLTRAKAIGCPSLFAYPRSIAGLSHELRGRRIISAGHITPRLLTRDGQNRATILLESLRGQDCAYVFQSELPDYTGLVGRTGLYDEALSTLDADVVNTEIERITGGIRPPFSTYYSFNDVSAWRQACARYDVYVGDRIHGGVAAMQARVPALILYDDARVAELTSYHGIPSCPVTELAEKSVEQCVDEYLNKEAIESFKQRYVKTLRKYVRCVERSGLRLANKGDIETAVDTITVDSGGPAVMPKEVLVASGPAIAART